VIDVPAPLALTVLGLLGAAGENSSGAAGSPLPFLEAFPAPAGFRRFLESAALSTVAVVTKGLPPAVLPSSELSESRLMTWGAKLGKQRFVEGVSAADAVTARFPADLAKASSEVGCSSIVALELRFKSLSKYRETDSVRARGGAVAVAAPPAAGCRNSAKWAGFFR
jgi:hypothetical protein